MRKIFWIALSGLSMMCQAQIDLSITGDDSLCFGQSAPYSVEISQSANDFLYRDTAALSPGGRGFFALSTGYDYMDITNTFSYDLWVKPTRTINMKGESNVCAGGVSVPLANSNQNWAIVPSGLGGGNMSVGLTIGTNGIMVGEHSGNILVSRLSYTTPINDWVHVAIVYRTDSIFLYMNGDLVRSRLTHCPTNQKCLAIGLTGHYYGPDFQGNVDEFRLWDIPLTRSQILNVKDKKLMNQVDGLRYYASFDNGKFERTLGDLGVKDMVANMLTPEAYLKKSSWEMDTYTGQNIDHLTKTAVSDLSYRWSNGETGQNILYTTLETTNLLSVEAYNEHYAAHDTTVVSGYDCGQVILYDTIVIHDTIVVNDCEQNIGQDIRYVKFESYYSEDNAQVNVYEIETYNNGSNVALFKPAVANSTNGSGPHNAVDGNGSSRWSGNRHDVGPDSLNPHFIVVDLLENFRIDSLVLNIEGFDHWNQNFSFQVSSDSASWHEIGHGMDTTGIFTYYPHVGNVIYDTVVVHDTIIQKEYLKGSGQEIQYLKFESYYSEDRGQVNVYEIESYFNGSNVALHKPAFANSTNGSGPQNAVDGNGSSRWSGNRNDAGPDSLNPHFIVVDLLEMYSIDSLVLNIEGFDHWNQYFSFQVSNDSVKWHEIGYGLDTTGIFTYYPHLNPVVFDTVISIVYDTISVYDTVQVIETIPVYDTIPVYEHIAVTDTLVIDAVLTGIDPPGNTNTILIYPNPAKDHLFINTGDYNRMDGYTLKIYNQTGSAVYESNMEEPLYEVDLSSWTGQGLYFVQVFDSEGNIIDIKKIILQ